MTLFLPQASVFFEPGQNAYSSGDTCPLIVLGGRPPLPSWLTLAASGREVWAADHGVDACMSAGVKPSRVLGDFDSVSAEGAEWLARFEPEIQIERFGTDKDLTDFQLCLTRLAGFDGLAGLTKNALVTGCWGGRFDHAFANVFSALWGVELGVNIRAFADETELLLPLERGALELRLLSEASAVSLLPLCGTCRGVSVRGTKWELSDAELFQGRPYAVSNAPMAEKISVAVEEGVLGVYCFFERGAL